MEDIQIAIQFAKKNGYKTAVRENVKEWRFFNKLPIYTPVFDSDEIPFTGLPQFIVIENGIPRFLELEEIASVMGFSLNLTTEEATLTEDEMLT
ncbi:MAG: hypothetical protein FWF53_06875 [Candidatus Azobacteroides sp.]|nr:hypothetical protein [Candidatus Azobacteroides sp.]